MNESLAAISVRGEFTTSEAAFAELTDRVEDMAVSVINVEVNSGASSASRTCTGTAHSVGLDGLTDRAALSVDGSQSVSTAETKPGVLVEGGAVSSRGDALTVGVDELVERASSARVSWIGTITETALSLDESVVCGAGIAVEDVGEVEAVSGKGVALLIDEELSGRARRNTGSSCVREETVGAGFA
jgi:hypothetical protein